MIVKTLELNHIPAGKTVTVSFGPGINYTLTAPEEAGTYSLYHLRKYGYMPAGWRWERE